MSRLRIAIQSKGRLQENSISFLKSQGLKFEINGRSLVTPCIDQEIDVLLLRNSDIPEYVHAGVAEFGIVGENVLQEKNTHVRILKKLGFGICRLVIAVPEDSPIQSVEDLEGERIATSYPKFLTKFLQEKGIHAAIIPISGSVEVTPELNLADAICDLVQTGSTLKAHGLKELVTILESEAVLIQSLHHTSESSFFS